MVLQGSSQSWSIISLHRVLYATEQRNCGDKNPLLAFPRAREKKAAPGLLASVFSTACPREGHLAASFPIDIPLWILPFALDFAL